MSDIVPGTIESWAALRPNDVALIEGERSHTYKEWNDQADRVAHALAARGVNRGDIVILRTQIRSEWAILASALAKLGCSLLALNWRLTPTETEYVLSNSRANVIICDDPDPEALKPAFAAFDMKLAVSIDAVVPGFVHYRELLEGQGEPLISRGDPPLIIYTSGTTGLPKGVAMTGRGPANANDTELMEYLSDVGRRGSPGQGDAIVLMTMPMHHGAGPGQVWGALRSGKKTIMMRRFDPEGALALIQKYRVTNWTGVPTMFKRIAGLPPEKLAAYDVSSIRSVGVGASAVPFSLKQWIIATFGENRLSEGYGATETGMISFLPSDMQTRKPGSSGRPYKHVEIKIRDEDGNDLAAGETGEIWVKTPVVIRHYLNSSPLGEDTLGKDGFFRVGDVGRVDEEGYLFITDRAKDMIVSGGVNIYPAEIEAAIITHPAVQDVAVIGIPDDEFGEQVKAFCELKPGRTATAEDVLAHCRPLLASYKHPRSIDFVKELPRNTMGKLLKRELREPYWKDRERKV